jgi:hypothetical protein
MTRLPDLLLGLGSLTEHIDWVPLLVPVLGGWW